jgi:hypothetical protein
MRDGAGTPAELEAGLSVDYPLVRVVAGINEGGVDRWYAYRDGSVLAIAVAIRCVERLGRPGRPDLPGRGIRTLRGQGGEDSAPFTAR